MQGSPDVTSATTPPGGLRSAPSAAGGRTPQCRKGPAGCGRGFCHRRPGRADRRDRPPCRGRCRYCLPSFPDQTGTVPGRRHGPAGSSGRAGRELGEAPDAGAALFRFVSDLVELALQKRDLTDELAQEGLDHEVHAAVKEELQRAFDVLLRRAQEAGAVREDIGSADVTALVMGTCLVCRPARRPRGHLPPGRRHLRRSAGTAALGLYGSARRYAPDSPPFPRHPAWQHGSNGRSRASSPPRRVCRPDRSARTRLSAGSAGFPTPTSASPRRSPPGLAPGLA